MHVADYEAACAGHGDQLAPAYHGRSHPVAIIDTAIPQQPLGIVGPDGPIQLAVCVGPSSLVKTGSCGLYKRSSDGKIGYVYKYKQARKVAVRAIQNGKALLSATLYGNSASCTSGYSIDNYPPPWRVSGGPVSDSQINTYAKQVSTMKF
jgi:hypothetical protein